MVPAQLFRETVYLGDPDRDWTIVWSRGYPTDPGSIGLIRAGDTGDLESVYLRGPGGVLVPTKNFHLRERTQFESWHWKAFRVPRETPIGGYPVVVNNRTVGEIKVVHRSTPNPRSLRIGEVVANIKLAPNDTLRAYGTVLTGDMAVSPGCTVTGLTIDGNVSGSFDNCVFDSCTFRRGQVGPSRENDYGNLFRDCVFQNSTLATCSGCFLRCRWEGPTNTGNHNFVNERSERLAVLDCTFRRTDRGLVLRSTWGPNSDNLYAGIQFNDINSTPNGGELFCVEGAGSGFNRNLIFCVRQNGCVGGVMLFDSIASDNIFDNIRIPIDIVGMNKQTGNIIQDSEVDYVHINWPKGDGTYFDGAKDTLLQRVACIGFKPSARGQASGDPKYYTPGQFRAVVEDGSSNPSTKAIGLTVSGQAQGFAQKIGVME